jgi:hypothetical protein
MDTDFATAWRVMRRFCLLVNLGMQTHRFMRLEIIHGEEGPSLVRSERIDLPAYGC